MIFNSLHFLFYFIAISLSFYALPHRWRWLLLLLASCYFYMAFVPEYLLILLFTIVIDYIAGIYLEKTTGPTKRWLLIISIISNVGILAVFKYFDFFTENLNALTQLVTGRAGTFQNLDNFMGLGVKILLPIGLSFHTFQAMSYTIEVYRGAQKAERHFGIYALYVMFYPQLVAGPIERPQNILYQFHQKISYNWANIKEGLMRMAWGFFKKVVIADRLGLMVDAAYQHNSIESTSGLTLAAATVFYAIQIYCDFSGYSDIAIGSAKVMGFNLMDNFQSPYFSKSIAEFWRRWHISLSTWFRDYLYIPLGGSKMGKIITYRNTLIVFLLSGLWHGNRWNFVIWGALHGLYLIVGQIKNGVLGQKWGSQKYPILHWALTFVLVMLAWVFFRAENLTDALQILSNIVTLKGGMAFKAALHTNELLFSVLLIALLHLKEYFWPKINTEKNQQFYLLIGALALLCYFFGVFNAKQFIYFQF
jgi:alginate O-acetyltransferase complex protein AlgI